MKRLFVLFALFAFLLSACTATTATLNQLPDEGRQLILILITAALTWVLLQLSMALHIDLSGYAAPIAAVLSPIIITIIESYLKLIPPVFDNLVLSIIHLIVLFVGSLGTYLFLIRMKNKQAKQLLAK